MAWNLGVAMIYRELWHPKEARKVSGLLRYSPKLSQFDSTDANYIYADWAPRPALKLPFCYK